MILSKYFPAVLSLALIVSCKQGPSETELFPQPRPIAHISLEGLSKDLHKVEVVEVIPASRYLYLRVKENDRLFWIATGRFEVRPGQTYFYRESLLKTNFESRELQNVYDTLYLVTKMIPVEVPSTIHGVK